MFYRFVFHITGVVLMVLVFSHWYPGIHTSSDLKTVTERKQSYYERSRRHCMSDIEINIGYIGDDIIALCDDHESSYAFHAEFSAERNLYLTRMSSSHGLITTGRFHDVVNARQMVMIAMSKHMDVLAKKERHAQQDEVRQLPEESGKLH